MVLDFAWHCTLSTGSIVLEKSDGDLDLDCDRCAALLLQIRDGESVSGLMCNTQTRQWQWADGSPLSYKPPSGGDDFSCVFITNNRLGILPDLYEECTTATSWYLQGEGSWSGG